MKFRYLLVPAILAVPVAEADVGVGVKAGTTGASLELTFPLADRFNVRAGYNALEYSDDYEETEVTYDAELEMSSASVMLDWHPFGGGWRVSAGLFHFFDGRLGGDGEPVEGTYTINDTVYQASDLADVSVDAEIDDFAPYLGLGWGNAVGEGRFSFVFDLGFIHTGSPDVSVDYTCIDPAACASIDDDIQAELDDLEEDLQDYDWWPVINVGVAMKF